MVILELLMHFRLFFSPRSPLLQCNHSLALFLFLSPSSLFHYKSIHCMDLSLMSALVYQNWFYLSVYWTREIS